MNAERAACGPEAIGAEAGGDSREGSGGRDPNRSDSDLCSQERWYDLLIRWGRREKEVEGDAKEIIRPFSYRTILRAV